jgi:tetratricopeptide (TPR) repeat protein
MLASLSQMEQSFVEPNPERFHDLATQTKEFFSEDNEYTRRYQYLPAAMQANQLFSEGRFEAAHKLYSEAIRNVENIRKKVKRKQAKTKDQRNLDYFTIVLALLYCNLGVVLRKLNKRSDEVDSVFQKAISLAPNEGHILSSLAFRYIDDHQWEKAEQAFRDVYRSAPSDETEKRLKENLCHMWIEQGTALFSEGEHEEALHILQNRIFHAKKWSLQGWEGKFHFTLADCLESLKQYQKALEAFEKGIHCYENDQSFIDTSYLSERKGDLHVSLHRDAEARQAYEEALSYTEKVKGKDAEKKNESIEKRNARQARLWSRLGVLQLRSGDFDEASKALDKSYHLVSKQEWFNPFQRIVSEAEPLLSRDDLLTALKIFFHSELRRSSDLERKRDLIDALRRIFDKSFHLVTEDHAIAWQRPDSDYPFMNVVTPLAIEIDMEILTRVGGEKDIIDLFVPDMRERIEHKYGVKLPGIRLRGNETDLALGTYIIMIHEVPVVSGMIETEGGVVLSNEAEISEAGFSTDKPVASAMEYGFWLDADSYDKARAAGLKVWKPLEYMIRHLEVVVSGRLIDFVAHQEVQNHLERAELVSVDRYEELVERESQVHMDPLTQIVRSLVAERVPINDFRLIHRIFIEGQREGSSAQEIVQRIRLEPAIRDCLWGNDASYRFVLLDKSVTEIFETACSGNGVNAVALKPEDVQDILTAIREALDNQKRIAVVVPQHQIRAFVQGMLELEFPDVPVLSLAELKPGLGNKIEQHVKL